MEMVSLKYTLIEVYVFKFTRSIFLFKSWILNMRHMPNHVLHLLLVVLIVDDLHGVHLHVLHGYVLFGIHQSLLHKQELLISQFIYSKSLMSNIGKWIQI